MMLVVSDASAHNVLIRIERVPILPGLFGRVVIPPAVARELSTPRTPEVVRSFAAASGILDLKTAFRELRSRAPDFRSSESLFEGALERDAVRRRQR